MYFKTFHFWAVPFLVSGRLDRIGLNVYVQIGLSTFHVRLQRGRRQELKAYANLF